MTTFFASRTAAASFFRPSANPKHYIQSFPCHLPPVRINAQSRCIHDSSFDKQHPRDEKINHRVVQLVNPATGRLTPPTTMQEVLASIDRKRQFVELVSVEPSAIVKIIDKKDAFEKRKQQKLRAKDSAKKNVQKEVQLTWGVATGDLMHKLNKVRQELEKGSRVDLVFAPKKGQPLPSAAEMQKRARETVESLSEVGKEWKVMETRKTVIAVFLQGIKQDDTLRPHQDIKLYDIPELEED